MFKYVQCFVLLAAVLIPLSANSVRADCLPDPDERGCAPIRDLTKQVRRDIDLPNLAELRSERHHAMLPSRLAAASTVPASNGIGTGITYQPGQLPATQGATLSATMIIDEFGLEPSTDGLDWIITTATNRTQDSLEIAAIYNQGNPGVLGIFDWSCSETSPCDGGITDPAWTFTMDMSNLSCNKPVYRMHDGLRHQLMNYRNVTLQTAGGWTNNAYLWDVCGRSWDWIYTHDYTGPLEDCSINNDCAWWGPIIEAFPAANGDPLPQIDQLGFQDVRLVADNGIAHMTAASPTNGFTYPPAPWQLLFLDTHHNFTVGDSLSK